MADLARTFSECIPEGRCNYGNYLFTRIEFTASDNFWIDDLYIAGQAVNGENQYVTRQQKLFKTYLYKWLQFPGYWLH